MMNVSQPVRHARRVANATVFRPLAPHSAVSRFGDGQLYKWLVRTFSTLGLLATTDAAATERPAGTIVRTPAGPIVGGLAGPKRDVRVYRGIPYAQPPVGADRWRPARALAPWTKPLRASSFAADCWQPSTMDVLAKPEKDFFYHPPGRMSEDCLYLNVWTPRRASIAKRPVMVWIHGGGEVQGSGSWPLYDGAALARKGAVVVTLNYRLGIFGRFALPELSAESRQGSGTADMSDLVQALRWVRANIESFGGDPGNVTIFGQSSGAMYVAALMTSPPARGLFHKAIGESGFAFFDPVATRTAAEAKGQAFATSVGQPTLAGLRSVSAPKLLARSRAAGFSMSPPIDGHYLPEAPCRVFLDGRQARVPLITGYVADEQFGWQPPLPAITHYPQYEAAVRHLLGYYGSKGVADTFLAMVPPARWTPDMTESLVRGYLMTGWQTESWAEAMSRVTPDVYLYRFDQPPQGAATAFHTAEVSYVFNNEVRAPRYSPNMPALSPRPSDLKLADAMSDYWVSFAKTGVPAAAGQAAWPRYGGEARRAVVSFRDTGAHPLPAFFPQMRFRNLCDVTP